MDDSRRLYQRAIAGYENAVGTDHLSTLGVVNNLGALELTEGNIVEAQALYERALAGREKILGLEHVKTLNTCQHLATALKRRGKWLKKTWFGRPTLSTHPLTTNQPSQY